MQDIHTSSHHNSIRYFWRICELFMETVWSFVPSRWCGLIGESSRYSSQNYKEWGKDECSVLPVVAFRKATGSRFSVWGGCQSGCILQVSSSCKIQPLECQNLQRVTLTLPDIFSLKIPTIVDNWWLLFTNEYAGRWHNITVYPCSDSNSFGDFDKYINQPTTITLLSRLN